MIPDLDREPTEEETRERARLIVDFLLWQLLVENKPLEGGDDHKRTSC